MRVTAFNCSPRKEGNTALLLTTVLAELSAAGVETELFQVGGRRLQGCTACLKCYTNKDGRCSVTTDGLNDYLAAMAASDGVLIGSPTYFASVTAEAKALIDRVGMTARANDNMLRRKVGAAVVAVRRAGALTAFDTINHLFTIGEMIIVGSTYWNVGLGRKPGEVAEDEEGMATMRDLGRNMAWLLKRLED